jgi:two-component system nitrate/nitrite response regulator NarL
VLIVDDHPVLRRGLRTMLEDEPWVEEVYEAATVADALKETVVRQVQLIVMDVTLPDGDGIDATQRILRARPDTAVLILTMSDDDEIVARALQAGARGYLAKDTDPDIIGDALRTVARGGLVLGPRIGPAFLGVVQEQRTRLPPPLDQLTVREREILALLAAGESNAGIARQIGLSEKTVRNQLSTIFTKLGVADRLKAALLARSLGLVR